MYRFEYVFKRTDTQPDYVCLSDCKYTIEKMGYDIDFQTHKLQESEPILVIVISKYLKHTGKEYSIEYELTRKRLDGMVASDFMFMLTDLLMELIQHIEDDNTSSVDNHLTYMVE